MEFKDLKIGFSVYILEKTDKVYKEGKVVAVSMPHFIQPNGLASTSMNRVVDITVETDCGSKVYVVDENDKIAYYQNSVISCDKHGLVLELKAIKGSAEDELSKVDKYKADIVRCDELISELDDTEREKQITEKRLSQLEDGVGEIKGSMNEILKLLKHNSNPLTR